MIVLGQPIRQFCRAGRLTGSLQPNHQENTRRLLRKLKLGLSPTEQLDQLIANHPDDLLPGSERFQHFLSKRPLLDAFDEFLGDFKMNIRIQQRIAYLARCLFDVPAGDSSLPG